jgi:hypothetical protein
VIADYLFGALTACAAVAGLFFFRFYRATRDRLFLAFAVAFWVLGLHWLMLAGVHPSEESRHALYLVRLAAFVILIAGIIDRNRRR